MLNGRTRPTIAALAITVLAPVALGPVASSAVTPAATLEQLSLNRHGNAPNADSGLPDISADGDWATFNSYATRLLDDEVVSDAREQLYLLSRETGDMELVSRGVKGRAGNGNSSNSVVSADGQLVLFESNAWNLVPRDRDDERDELYLRDIAAGTTTLVAQGLNGKAANGWSYLGDMSADNRFVVFYSNASNLVAEDTARSTDVFLLDRTTGVTSLISEGTGDPLARGNLSTAPKISADGRIVVYASDSNDLVPGDHNRSRDVFAYDTQTQETTLVSRSMSGGFGRDDSDAPDISGDGRYVSFTSEARNLTPEGSHFENIFLRDLSTGETTLISRAPDGSLADGRSRDSQLSEDGTAVAFRSDAGNLVLDDANGVVADVFIVDTDSGVATRVSQPLGPHPDDSWSTDPAITADGSGVVFTSNKHLVDEDRNQFPDVYLWTNTD